MRFVRVISFAAVTAGLLCPAPGGLEAQTSLQYQEPPKALVDLVDTRPTPNVEVSPRDKQGRQWLLIETISGLPSVAAAGAAGWGGASGFRST